MSEPDVIYECHDADTSYRLAPSAEAPPGTGYRYGAVLEWRDEGETDWKGYFFVAPEALKAMAKALTLAAGATQESRE